MLFRSQLRDRDAAFQNVPVDLTELVSRVVSMEVAFATACGISLSATVPDRAVHVQGDPRLFELTLENLIDNAIRHSKPGGSVIVDLDAPAAGKFVLRCQVDDHMQAGMWTRYEVLPAAGNTP